MKFCLVDSGFEIGDALGPCHPDVPGVPRLEKAVEPVAQGVLGMEGSRGLVVDDNEVGLVSGFESPELAPQGLACILPGGPQRGNGFLEV